MAFAIRSLSGSPDYSRIEVSPGTRVAANSVGLLLGFLVFGCGGSERADTGLGELPPRNAATAVAVPDTEHGAATDPAATAPGLQRIPPAVVGQSRPVHDAGDERRRSIEVVTVGVPPDQAGMDDDLTDVRSVGWLSAAPVGSSGISAVDQFGASISRPPNDELVLRPVARIDGEFAAKSIVASGTGLYFAQNMMYLHTVSVLDHTKSVVKAIDDSVDLREFGHDVSGDAYRGAPVEAAFTSDGSFAFVSNYRMYGPGYDPQAGGDSCGRDQGQNSFVYRIDAETLEIDRVYPVGPVPKQVAVSPDDRLLLVSNWCGFDVTVIDLATRETLAAIDVGRYPRGIAITSDSKTAYVALMGTRDIAVLDLSAFSTYESHVVATGKPVRTYLRDVGISPRHLALSPDDRTLYATLNGEDAVVAVDLDLGQVVLRIETGRAPRSMDISTDGTALYVVNYKSHTMSKIRTRDFTVLQEFDTAPKPIGITYDPFNDEVWVSTYSGTIHVYAEHRG